MSASGVIVAVAHDEFRGMGLSGVGEFLGAGAIDAMAAEPMGCYYGTP